jgi:hypothetical protein
MEAWVGLLSPTFGLAPHLWGLGGEMLEVGVVGCLLVGCPTFPLHLLTVAGPELCLSPQLLGLGLGHALLCLLAPTPL